jgi:hypothetical protein
MAASSVHGLGFTPACTERPVSYTSVSYGKYGDRIPVRDYAMLPLVTWEYYAYGLFTSLMKQAEELDPPFSHIGIGSDLRNQMPDTGASSHFTPCLLNL